MLRVTYAGRSLLLTGDLEGPGLDAVLQTPRTPIDVLLAPHHGATAANTAELAAWCAPEVVIASTGDRDRTAALTRIYGPDCRVLSTANEGAIRVQITPEGELSARGFLDAH